MIIWLLNPYGPIPGEGWRDYRCTLMGKALAARGHQVTWWTANFAHHFKVFRSAGWEERSIVDGFRIILVPSGGYTRNISLDRVRFEFSYAKNLKSYVRTVPSPDIIVAQSPSMTHVFAQIADTTHAKLIIDIFDLWPELFTIVLPFRFRSLGRLLWWPLYAQRRHALRKCNALMAVCDTYLSLGLREMFPSEPAFSQIVFIGIDLDELRNLKVRDDELPALRTSLGKNDDDIWAIYAGSLGDNYDISTLLNAAQYLEERNPRIKFLLAGDGPLQSYVCETIRAKHLTNTRFLGKLPLEQLARYYQVSDIGICPYVADSTVAMPTKVYDYFAAGLPVVNSLGGELAQMLRDFDVGVQYQAGDARSLAEAVAYVGENPAKRKKMASNSYQISQKFDQSVLYDRFVDFVEQVAGRGASQLDLSTLHA